MAYLIRVNQLKINLMKLIYSILCLSLLVMGCQPAPDNSASEAFERNSQTVLDNLENFQNESMDYSEYAADFVMRDTGFGAKDSLSLDDVMEHDKALWGNYDFKLVTDPLSLLPGVDVDTKLADGSVRYYANWEVTLAATDSTDAKSGVIGLYESFDFNADGKIIFQQVYGDFTGLFTYLHTVEMEETEEE
ncbi:MAG: hypothetical protein COA50_11220 [Flavobacteriaceae bacterium]|nr:MAG: hypothetical protein COA50_11220 [Flavobacteriaceae bacterium]